MALWCLWERSAGKLCTVCIKWNHKRSSGVRVDLSLAADGFRCKRCDGTIQEADFAGHLVVDGNGGADLAATAFAISDIQSSPARDERSSVCQLCQK